MGVTSLPVTWQSTRVPRVSVPLPRRNKTRTHAGNRNIENDGVG